jgi:hypothetical protein
MVKTEKCLYLMADGTCSKPSRDKCRKKRLPYVPTLLCYHVPVVQDGGCPAPTEDPHLTTCEDLPLDPHALSAQLSGVIPPEPPVVRPPPCLGGSGCDQKPSQFRHDKVRGPVCDAIGSSVRQLPQNRCPYDVKKQVKI